MRIIKFRLPGGRSHDARQDRKTRAFFRPGTLPSLFIARFTERFVSRPPNVPRERERGEYRGGKVKRRRREAKTMYPIV